MKSTLPVLTARATADGGVEVADAANVVHKFDHWRPDKPDRSCTLVYLNKTYYRLRWLKP